MPEYRTLRGKSERKEKKNMGTISLVEFPRKRQRRAEKQATVKISSQDGRRRTSRGKCHERLRTLHSNTPTPVTLLEDQEQKYNPKCASQRKEKWAGLGKYMHLYTHHVLGESISNYYGFLTSGRY